METLRPAARTARGPQEGAPLGQDCPARCAVKEHHVGRRRPWARGGDDGDYDDRGRNRGAGDIDASTSSGGGFQPQEAAGWSMAEAKGHDRRHF